VHPSRALPYHTVLLQFNSASHQIPTVLPWLRASMEEARGSSSPTTPIADLPSRRVILDLAAVVLSTLPGVTLDSPALAETPVILLEAMMSVASPALTSAILEVVSAILGLLVSPEPVLEALAIRLDSPALAAT